MVTRVTEGSKESIAENLVATLNNATREFGHAQYTLFLRSHRRHMRSTKFTFLQTLQWIDTDVEIGVAGPFMKSGLGYQVPRTIIQHG